MKDTIRIQLMDNFTIYINERKVDQLVSKSRKGVNLIAYLILNNGEPVPNYRLLATLWTDDGSANPENALKTLVSRLRTMLNQVSPDLGRCIVADRGAYHWQTLENMTVDIYEIERIFTELSRHKAEPEICKELYQKLLNLYPGDLMSGMGGQYEWAMARSTSLHNGFLSAVYSYIDLLKAEENYEEIAALCRRALDVDSFDDRLHMELMTSLIHTNRTSDALSQYKHVMHLNYRYLGVSPSEEMQEFYKKIVRAGKTLEFNMEAIRNELRESGEQRGAFVCEYAVFKEIYNLQMRNLERLGSTMFLGIIMVGDSEGTLDSIKQDNLMNDLLDILKQNLRKGDTITHFSPTMYALLLPTVNYTTGNMVMERIKRLYYRRHPNSDVPFNYRLGPLSSDMRASELALSDIGTDIPVTRK